MRATIVLGSTPARFPSSCCEIGSSASRIWSIPKCIGCRPYSAVAAAKASNEAIEILRMRKPVLAFSASCVGNPIWFG